MDSEEPRVTVAVRVRPKLADAVNVLQQHERYEEVVCLPTSDTTLRLAHRRAGKAGRDAHFAYDRVFDVDATQEDVYEESALDAVDAVLAGTNASLLTYGQTGSGKTYTVLGNAASDTQRKADENAVVGPDSGLLLRAIQDMLTFAERMRTKQQRHVVLGITAIEIYKDEMRDLLRDGTTAALLQPIMTKDALHFPRLTHRPLQSLRDACDVYAKAAARRVQRATAANDTSSRSHAIFTIEVFQAPLRAADGSTLPPSTAMPKLEECVALREAQVTASVWAARPPPASSFAGFDGAANGLLCTSEGAPVLFSTLTVADLAGSEKAKQANVQGAGFDELRRINASLTALGNVVHHLYHNTPHVPYRDSKLTMMLRDTFAAPRARVVLVVNVSPTALTRDETLSSLYFADKMKGMEVPNGAPCGPPQQAALQTHYLASLRLHDALLAEHRIFRAQQEWSPSAPGLLQRVVTVTVTSGDHPLFHLPYHTARVGSDADNARQLHELCSKLKEEVQYADTPEVREQRFFDTSRRDIRKQHLMKYTQRRAEVHAQMAAAENVLKEERVALAETKATVRASLTTVTAEMRDAASQQQALLTAKAELMATLAHACETLKTLSPLREDVRDGEDEMAALENTTTFQSHETHEERRWSTQAVELAELRLLWVELLAYHARMPPPPLPPSQFSPSPSAPDTTKVLIDCRASSSNGASRTPTKSRSRSGTTSDGVPCLATHHVATEAWVRSAVLAMANNAVVQSMRRQARQSRAQNAVGDTENTCLFALENATKHSADAAKPMTSAARYWKVLQSTETNTRAPQTAKAPQPAESSKSPSTREGEAGPKQHRSSFDDPNLLCRVTAYLDMGAALTKLDRDGRARARWFYVTSEKGRLRLCWAASRRDAGLTGTSHLYLEAIEKIQLGCSSPALAKYAETTSSGDKAKMEGSGSFTCFTLLYHTRSTGGERKCLSVVCPDKTEMETWVVGLSHLSGVSPNFAGPDVTGRTSVAEPLHGEGGTLTAAAILLCRTWHIPLAVMQATRDGIESRRTRRASGRLRLTPGELRDLTGLDIFRASALWVHFAREEWLANPTRQLRCFVSEADVPTT